ncbi:cytochrome P450 [Zavarzinia sp. CC-PAN008]|uniref:cytochrome P450 n=1 Tax=Zavarzinia sp. CC-PAN008 TaxID=3243332 RepID=UPI003F74AB52
MDRHLDTQPVGGPDLKDPDLYVDHVPYDLFAALRRSAGVYWNPEADGRGFWSVLRHEDITAVGRQPEIFSSAAANGGHRMFDENLVSVANVQDAAFGTPFISVDPPLHQKRRGALVPALSATRLAQMEERLRRRAADLLDTVVPGAVTEWVDTVAAPFPLVTLCELMDLPAEDWKKLFTWTNALIAEDDPEMRESPEAMAGHMAEFAAYFDARLAERRAAPGDDLLSLMVNTPIEGQLLTRPQFLADMILVLVGGNETTRNSISQGVMAFARHPEQWRRLRADPGLIRTAVREVVRYVTPIMHMRRTATQDAMIGETRVAKGDKVILWYSAANRDEAVYPDPDRFDIGRDTIKHVAFGTGQHVCLGQRLAELQLKVMLQEMAARFAGFEQAGPERRMRSNFVNGIKTVPIIAHPA